MPYKNFLRDQLHSINGMTLPIYKISNQISNKEEESSALWEMHSITRDIITVMSEEIFIDENETNEGGAEEKSKIEIQEEICPNQRGNSGNNASKRKNSYP
jgi:hypothetical protein